MAVHAPIIVEEAEDARRERRLRMSYEEWLAWSEEEHSEWVDGEIIVFMPATSRHQAVLGFLFHLIATFVNFGKLGIVLIAPFEMRALPGGNAREPDILFVKKERAHLLTEDCLAGPADLVVEVISRESVTRDTKRKFAEYAAARVPEYWLVDPRPRKREARFYRLTEEGYELFGSEADEWVSSHVLPGFRLRPEWLWPPYEMDPRRAFYEMRGLSAAEVETIERLLRG